MTKYTDLLTSEHSTKPKFYAAVDATTLPLLQLQAVLAAIPGSYDLDSATGSRLDVIGEWVGASRFVLTPLDGVYFAFDTPGVGWDQGIWLGTYDPTSGAVALGDDAYRLLIRGTIIANMWDGTIGNAALLLDAIFPNNQIIVQDNGDMSMTIGVSGPTLDAESVSLLRGGYIAVKPFGVRLNVYFTSLPPYPVFGFDLDSAYIGGWDHGAWGVTDPITTDDD